MVVMRRSINSWLIIVVVFILKTQTSLTQQINRASFPKGFVFGTASSAFQYEGAVKEDGRGPSIWDSFSHSFGKVIDRTDADVAVDQYHRFAEDIQLMKDMSMDAYRFSISWSRIYPNGSGAINQAGIDHYSKLINALLAAGIEPYVTLYHWDLPQALDDTYKGWLSRQIIKDFAAFAETCFKEFGDRVKHWITFNEPHTFTIQGYDVGLQAPGRCSILQRLLCRAGNSTTEPYIVAHNVILTHATVVHIYRKKYKAKQRGSIGISLDVIWFTPASNSTKDIKATQRAQDFQLGWFIEPLILGDYPRSMKSRVKDRLPTFSKIEVALIKGSLDFVGINHYTTFYASDNSGSINLNDSVADSAATTIPFRGLTPISDRAYSIWLYIVPGGMRSLMNYIKNKYGNIPIMITENGMDDPNNRLTPIKDALKDEKRIKYHNDYLTNLLASIKEDGCNVKGYFVWSLLDNWEWAAGYTSRFGLYFVDFEHNLKRYPKDSVKWFKNFLTSS
ncbi:beta-glucosidase 40-like isoform X1 [Mercurialis annua]|uniref:beta-glucosidase 40-like isoform X1 n=1 Tax=Mercurialis annua TaxID=3986 RepID=UPI00215DFA38|nr:beta-glucosidase 40-like isoform X1 [Mercurialis annua]